MTLRLGLLAASRITEDAVVRPAREIDDVEIVALAARQSDRAQQFADRWGVGRACGYEDLITADDIDAVYIATPAALHRPWTLAALKAGKHVLVEKPLAANGADARLMGEAAAGSDRVVMEAFHCFYHPLFGQMRQVLEGLGPVERVEASFEVAAVNIPPTDIRYDLTLGGGSVMDIGIYPLAWVRWVFGERPRVVAAEAHCPVAGIDGDMAIDLAGPSGAQASVMSSMVAPGRDWVSSLTVRCDGGIMQVKNPLAPQHGAELVVETPGARVEHPVSRHTTYFHQLRAFRDAVLNGEPFPTTAVAGAELMELVDDCYRAAGLDPRPSWVGWSRPLTPR
jgi:predicted dehydrogenase